MKVPFRPGQRAFSVENVGISRFCEVVPDKTLISSGTAFRLGGEALLSLTFERGVLNHVTAEPLRRVTAKPLSGAIGDWRRLLGIFMLNGTCFCTLEHGNPSLRLHMPYYIAQRFRSILVLQGNAAGKYASQPLRACSAAQPKGCSACSVPGVDSPSDKTEAVRFLQM